MAVIANQNTCLVSKLLNKEGRGSVPYDGDSLILSGLVVRAGQSCSRIPPLLWRFPQILEVRIFPSSR